MCTSAYAPCVCALLQCLHLTMPAFHSLLNWLHLLRAASEDVVVKSKPASALRPPDVAALLSKRHVVTGWKVHSFTVSCHSTAYQLSDGYSGAYMDVAACLRARTVGAWLALDLIGGLASVG